MISDKSFFQVTPYEVYKISKTVLNHTYSISSVIFYINFFKILSLWTKSF